MAEPFDISDPIVQQILSHMHSQVEFVPVDHDPFATHEGPGHSAAPPPSLADSKFAHRLGAIGESLLSAFEAPGKALSGQYPLLLDPNAPGGVDPYGAMIPDATTLAGALDLGGISTAPLRPANALGIFGGVGAKTADTGALTQAQLMKELGSHPRDILDQTGWFQGADGQWRFEIPDKGTTMTPVHGTTLGESLSHPEFFAAYPEAKNISVSTVPDEGVPPGAYGYFTPQKNEITLLQGDPRDVTLHELQHWVQNKEGFARGTNPQYAERYAPSVMEHKMAQIDQIDQQAAEWMQDYMKKEGLDPESPNSHLAAQEAWAQANPKQSKIYTGLHRDIAAITDTPGHAVYERTAAEVEARNVQARKDISPKFLRTAIPPESTQDYPNWRQIILPTKGTPSK